eukprot:scaffold11153_cov125-Isochrysis_galbana.AAC.3
MWVVATRKSRGGRNWPPSHRSVDNSANVHPPMKYTNVNSASPLAPASTSRSHTRDARPPLVPMASASRAGGSSAQKSGPGSGLNASSLVDQWVGAIIQPMMRVESGQ